MVVGRVSRCVWRRDWSLTTSRREPAQALTVSSQESTFINNSGLSWFELGCALAFRGPPGESPGKYIF